MYNRYIPSADGSYRRQTVPEEKQVSRPAKEPAPEPIRPAQPRPMPMRGKNPFADLHLDSGDLLVLLILLLVLSEGEDCDTMTILITLAAFLILQ